MPPKPGTPSLAPVPEATQTSAAPHDRPLPQPRPHPPVQEDTITAPLTKQLYRVSEAMEILSQRRSTMYELLRTGRLRSVGEGHARRIPASAIHEYVALLEQEAASTATGRRAA